MISDRKYLQLIIGVFLLALVVVGLGAFTRLTEAGLGCPDWPGCYGFLTVPQTPMELLQAGQLFPDAPVEVDKAWYEMIHRYVAGSLGLLIALIAWFAWRDPKRFRVLPTLLLVLVCFQAALGMWTVTLSLMPIIVMAHLLGGFSTVTLLFLLAWQEKRRQKNIVQQQSFAKPASMAKIGFAKLLSVICLCVLLGQIALGGWTSANYAALVCTQLPICEGNWQQAYDITAFSPFSPDRETYQYGVLDYEKRVTIHATHRMGAILVSALLLFLIATIVQPLGWKSAALLLTALSGQVALGIGNVVAMLPLPVAVAHNLMGLVLLLSLIWVMTQLWRPHQHLN